MERIYRSLELAASKAKQLHKDIGKPVYVYGYTDIGDITRYLLTDILSEKHLLYFKVDK